MFVSIDGGATWAQMQANLPTVAVHDLTIHPRENDLVIATYGRALWTGDITPLQELSEEVLGQPVHLFDIEPRARYGFSTQGMNYHLFGDKYLEMPNEPEALAINYYLQADAPAEASITVSDRAGRVVREIRGPAKRGLNRVLVPLGGSGRGAAPVVPLAPGEYVVTLRVGREFTKRTTVRDQNGNR